MVPLNKFLAVGVAYLLIYEVLFNEEAATNYKS